MDELTRRAVETSVRWLDGHNGRTDHDLTLRILKVSEEAGEAAGAWIGTLGKNPRKGVTHDRGDVAAELADVAITAMVAIESLGFDASMCSRNARQRSSAGCHRPRGEAAGPIAG